MHLQVFYALTYFFVVFQEADNEMTISDVETGEFIAKKIIYD
jgi:hypothetical protein